MAARALHARLTDALADALARVDPQASVPVEELGGDLRRATAIVDLAAPLLPLRATRWLRGCIGRARRRLRRLERESAWHSSLQGLITGAGGARPIEPLLLDVVSREIKALTEPSAVDARRLSAAVAAAEARQEIAGAVEIFAAQIHPDVAWDEIDESLAQSAFRVLDAARRCLERPSSSRVARYFRRVRSLDDQLDATDASGAPLAYALGASEEDAAEALTVIRVLLARAHVLGQAQTVAARRVRRAPGPTASPDLIGAALTAQRDTLRDRALTVTADLFATHDQGQRASSH